MRGFINFIRLVILSILYRIKNRKFDENVVRDWVSDVLEKFNITVECKGEFDVEGCVVMANHSSYFDILALYKCISSKLLWVSKKELFKYPVIGKALKDIGAISVNRNNDRESAIALIRALRRFKEGALVIFPQGTRKEKSAFKKGGLLIAKKKNIPIFLVKIIGSESIMPVGKLILNSGKVIVEAMGKLKVEDFGEDELERIIRSKIY